MAAVTEAEDIAYTTTSVSARAERAAGQGNAWQSASAEEGYDASHGQNIGQNIGNTRLEHSFGMAYSTAESILSRDDPVRAGLDFIITGNKNGGHSYERSKHEEGRRYCSNPGKHIRTDDPFGFSSTDDPSGFLSKYKIYYERKNRMDLLWQGIKLIIHSMDKGCIEESENIRACATGLLRELSSRDYYNNQQKKRRIS